MTSPRQLAERFHSLHHSDTPLLLANAWDSLSAAIVADAGLPAVATASAAVALSRGYDDGEEIPFDLLVDLVERIRDVVDLPISVDFEQGYGETAAEVGLSASRLISAGAVGLNIEDSLDQDILRDVDEQCERIATVREAGAKHGVPIFINARTDVFMMGGDKEEGIGRLRTYAAAGADGAYPILCTDLELLARIHEAVRLPINVLLTPSLPPIESLLDAGVRRISMGPGLLSIAAGATEDAARRIASGDLNLAGLSRLNTTEMRRIQGITT
jgi:2-methylisocitrate lyase-like PEP mutase family enzyme